MAPSTRPTSFRGTIPSMPIDLTSTDNEDEDEMDIDKVPPPVSITSGPRPLLPRIPTNTIQPTGELSHVIDLTDDGELDPTKINMRSSVEVQPSRSSSVLGRRSEARAVMPGGNSLADSEMRDAPTVFPGFAGANDDKRDGAIHENEGSDSDGLSTDSVKSASVDIMPDINDVRREKLDNFSSETSDFTVWNRPSVECTYRDLSRLWEAQLEDFRKDNLSYTPAQLSRARQNEVAAYEQLSPRYKALLDTAAKSPDPWWLRDRVRNADRDTIYRFKKGSTKGYIEAPVVSFNNSAFTLAHTKAFYPLLRTQLGTSDQELLHWADGIDNMDERVMIQELESSFLLRMDVRNTEVPYIQRGKQLRPYIESFLLSLNLTEADMMRFLVDPSCDHGIGQMYGLQLSSLRDSSEKKALANAHLMHIRQDLKLSRLEDDIASRLKLETMDYSQKEDKLCYLALAFHIIADASERPEDNSAPFNPIYALKASPTFDSTAYLQAVSGILVPSPALQYQASTHFDMACTICHNYPCAHHGIASLYDYDCSGTYVETRETHRGRANEVLKNPRKWDSIETDPLQPLQDEIEYAFQKTMGSRMLAHAKGQRKRDVEFEDIERYERRDDVLRQMRTFFPCDHAGPCTPEVCHCKATHDRPCEKSCGCDATCALRFRGCNCKQQGKPCSTTRCKCVAAGRECDPDLCGRCGAVDALDPQNRNNEECWFVGRCQNCVIQRNMPKRTLAGESSDPNVRGYGLFAGEDIREGDYVGEYIGVSLTFNESERQGNLGGLLGCSYLFGMTDDPSDNTVDSMRLGNKTRLINSLDGKYNLDASIKLVNTERRLGFFATRNIKAGEELSYYYGKTFWKTVQGQTKEKKAAKKKELVLVKQKSKKGSKNTRLPRPAEVVPKRNQGELRKTFGRGSSSAASSSNRSKTNRDDEGEQSSDESDEEEESGVDEGGEEESDEHEVAETALDPDVMEQDHSDDEDFEVEPDEIAESSAGEHVPVRSPRMSTKANRRLRRKP